MTTTGKTDPFLKALSNRFHSQGINHWYKKRNCRKATPGRVIQKIVLKDGSEKFIKHIR